MTDDPDLRREPWMDIEFYTATDDDVRAWWRRHRAEASDPDFQEADAALTAALVAQRDAQLHHAQLVADARQDLDDARRRLAERLGF